MTAAVIGTLGTAPCVIAYPDPSHSPRSVRSR